MVGSTMSWEECLKCDCALQCWFVQHKNLMNHKTCSKLLQEKYLKLFLQKSIPTLYDLQQRQQNDHAMYYLESNPKISSESRMTILKQLYQSSSSTSTDGTIETQIHHFITSSTTVPTISAKPKSLIVNNIQKQKETRNFIDWIHTNNNTTTLPVENESSQKSTLQERIEARQKQSQQQQQQQKQESSNVQDQEQPLWRTADLIQARAQQIWKRFSQHPKKNNNSLNQEQNKKNHPKIPIPLPASISHLHLQNLQKTIPDWIQIIPDTIPDNQKDTQTSNIRVTVPILTNTIYVQTIRNQLLSSQTNHSETSTNTANTINHSNTLNTTNNHTSHRDHESKKRKRSSKLSLTKRSMSSIDGHPNDNKTEQNLTAKSKEFLPATINIMEKKRQFEEGTEYEDGEIQQTKKLRVNPYLHVTDADINGGLPLTNILHASNTTPRGLKRLFYQMNNGQRI